MYAVMSILLDEVTGTETDDEGVSGLNGGCEGWFGGIVRDTPVARHRFDIVGRSVNR